MYRVADIDTQDNAQTTSWPIGHFSTPIGDMEDTMLHIACQSDIMRLLLDCGANIQARAGTGLTPLHFVVTIVKRLLRFCWTRVQISRHRTNFRRTTFHMASYLGSLQAALLLLQLGGEIIAWWMETVTSSMCLNLLDRGANVEARDGCDYTPLHGSCKVGHLKLAQLLLDWGATMDWVGLQPLHSACKCGSSVF